MARRSLSPKRAAERMRQHRHAVMVMAMLRAQRAVQADIRAQGLKLAQFTAKEISVLAEAYMAQHREEPITKAVADVATFPEFARYLCAELSSHAQTPKPPISTTSAVQNSGAEWGADQ